MTKAPHEYTRSEYLARAIRPEDDEFWRLMKVAREAEQLRRNVERELLAAAGLHRPDETDRALKARSVPKKVKAAYQMARHEENQASISVDRYCAHKSVIARALAAGLNVPPDVLSEYPALSAAA